MAICKKTGTIYVITYSVFHRILDLIRDYIFIWSPFFAVSGMVFCSVIILNIIQQIHKGVLILLYMKITTLPLAIILFIYTAISSQQNNLFG